MKPEDFKENWKERATPKVSGYELPEEETPYERRVKAKELNLRPNPFEDERVQRTFAKKRTPWLDASDHKARVKGMRHKLSSMGEEAAKGLIKKFREGRSK